MLETMHSGYKCRFCERRFEKDSWLRHHQQNECKANPNQYQHEQPLVADGDSETTRGLAPPTNLVIGVEHARQLDVEMQFLAEMPFAKELETKHQCRFCERLFGEIHALQQHQKNSKTCSMQPEMENAAREDANGDQEKEHDDSIFFRDEEKGRLHDASMNHASQLEVEMLFLAQPLIAKELENSNEQRCRFCERLFGNSHALQQHQNNSKACRIQLEMDLRTSFQDEDTIGEDIEKDAHEDSTGHASQLEVEMQFLAQPPIAKVLESNRDEQQCRFCERLFGDSHALQQHQNNSKACHAQKEVDSEAALKDDMADRDTGEQRVQHARYLEVEMQFLTKQPTPIAEELEECCEQRCRFCERLFGDSHALRRHQNNSKACRIQLQMEVEAATPKHGMAVAGIIDAVNISETIQYSLAGTSHREAELVRVSESRSMEGEAATETNIMIKRCALLQCEFCKRHFSDQSTMQLHQTTNKACRAMQGHEVWLGESVAGGQEENRDNGDDDDADGDWEGPDLDAEDQCVLAYTRFGMEPEPGWSQEHLSRHVRVTVLDSQGQWHYDDSRDDLHKEFKYAGFAGEQGLELWEAAAAIGIGNHTLSGIQKRLRSRQRLLQVVGVRVQKPDSEGGEELCRYCHIRVRVPTSASNPSNHLQNFSEATLFVRLCPSKLATGWNKEAVFKSNTGFSEPNKLGERTQYCTVCGKKTEWGLPFKRLKADDPVTLSSAPSCNVETAHCGEAFVRLEWNKDPEGAAVITMLPIGSVCNLDQVPNFLCHSKCASPDLSLPLTRTPWHCWPRVLSKVVRRQWPITRFDDPCSEAADDWNGYPSARKCVVCEATSLAHKCQRWEAVACSDEHNETPSPMISAEVDALEEDSPQNNEPAGCCGCWTRKAFCCGGCGCCGCWKPRPRQPMRRDSAPQPPNVIPSQIVISPSEIVEESGPQDDSQQHELLIPTANCCGGLNVWISRLKKIVIHQSDLDESAKRVYRVAFHMQSGYIIFLVLLGLLLMPHLAPWMCVFLIESLLEMITNIVDLNAPKWSPSWGGMLTESRALPYFPFWLGIAAVCHRTIFLGVVLEVLGLVAIGTTTYGSISVYTLPQDVEWNVDDEVQSHFTSSQTFLIMWTCAAVLYIRCVKVLKRSPKRRKRLEKLGEGVQAGLKKARELEEKGDKLKETLDKAAESGVNAVESVEAALAGPQGSETQGDGGGFSAVIMIDTAAKAELDAENFQQDVREVREDVKDILDTSKRSQSPSPRQEHVVGSSFGSEVAGQKADGTTASAQAIPATAQPNFEDMVAKEESAKSRLELEDLTSRSKRASQKVAGLPQDEGANSTMQRKSETANTDGGDRGVIKALEDGMDRVNRAQETFEQKKEAFEEKKEAFEEKKKQIQEKQAELEAGLQHVFGMERVKAAKKGLSSQLSEQGSKITIFGKSPSQWVDFVLGMQEEEEEAEEEGEEMEPLESILKRVDERLKLMSRTVELMNLAVAVSIVAVLISYRHWFHSFLKDAMLSGFYPNEEKLEKERARSELYPPVRAWLVLLYSAVLRSLRAALTKTKADKGLFNTAENGTKEAIRSLLKALRVCTGERGESETADKPLRCEVLENKPKVKGRIVPIIPLRVLFPLLVVLRFLQLARALSEEGFGNMDHVMMALIWIEVALLLLIILICAVLGFTWDWQRKDPWALIRIRIDWAQEKMYLEGITAYEYRFPRVQVDEPERWVSGYQGPGGDDGGGGGHNRTAWHSKQVIRATITQDHGANTKVCGSCQFQVKVKSSCYRRAQRRGGSNTAGDDFIEEEAVLRTLYVRLCQRKMRAGWDKDEVFRADTVQDDKGVIRCTLCTKRMEWGELIKQAARLQQVQEQLTQVMVDGNPAAQPDLELPLVIALTEPSDERPLPVCTLSQCGEAYLVIKWECNATDIRKRERFMFPIGALCDGNFSLHLDRPPPDWALTRENQLGRREEAGESALPAQACPTCQAMLDYAQYEPMVLELGETVVMSQQTANSNPLSDEVVQMVEGQLKRHPMAACSTLSILVTEEGREGPAGCFVLKMCGNSLLGGWDETSVQTAHTDLDSGLRKCLNCGAMTEESILQFKARLDPPAAVDSLPVRVTPTVRVARCGTCWLSVEMGEKQEFLDIGLKHGADPMPEVVLDGEIDAVVNGKRRCRGGMRVFDQQLQRPVRHHPQLEQSNAAAPDQCIECQGASSRFFGDIEAALHNGKVKFERGESTMRQAWPTLAEKSQASLEVSPAEGESEVLSQYEQAERIAHALWMLRGRLAQAELQGHTHCEPRHGGSCSRSLVELSRERARGVNGFVRAFFREELAKMEAIEDHSVEGSDDSWELRSWVGGAQTTVVFKAVGHGCSLHNERSVTVLAVGRSESGEPGPKRWEVLGQRSPKIDIEGMEFEEGGPAARDERAEDTGTPAEAFVEPG